MQFTLCYKQAHKPDTLLHAVCFPPLWLQGSFLHHAFALGRSRVVSCFGAWQPELCMVLSLRARVQMHMTPCTTSRFDGLCSNLSRTTSFTVALSRVAESNRCERNRICCQKGSCINSNDHVAPRCQLHSGQAASEQHYSFCCGCGRLEVMDHSKRLRKALHTSDRHPRSAKR